MYQFGFYYLQFQLKYIILVFCTKMCPRTKKVSQYLPLNNIKVTHMFINTVNNC